MQKKSILYPSLWLLQLTPEKYGCVLVKEKKYTKVSFF